MSLENEFGAILCTCFISSNAPNEIDGTTAWLFTGVKRSRIHMADEGLALGLSLVQLSNSRGLAASKSDNIEEDSERAANGSKTQRGSTADRNLSHSSRNGASLALAAESAAVHLTEAATPATAGLDSLHRSIASSLKSVLGLLEPRVLAGDELASALVVGNGAGSSHAGGGKESDENGRGVHLDSFLVVGVGVGVVS
ncbi:uncharacterized protein BDZ83DRAFT_728115 [Colletotrichum acutatum]|uniref:Uncharacterized protein n=1 Tax=Glomerella acutata TaxID=27357 RepID=A0AAD8USW5_GLOAC|nr:uncharacterized protein BDZ83DRAFT_728115 [Colletotrichum acutatum]KAK1728212.1 hypothetical protein BDZ83DRAFT_728115 [Colletotrichum acutatum]